MSTSTKKKSTLKVTSKIANQLLNSGVPPVSKTLVNHIALVIDESGSMNNIAKDALNALNSQLEFIKSQATSTGQKTTVSFYKFNDSVSRILSLYPVESVKPISDYWPNGSTSLMDAVEEAINGLERAPKQSGSDVSFLVIVVTDGQENSSQTTVEKVSKLIKQKQGTDRWSFVFSVPHVGTNYIQKFLGVPDGNIREWEQTTKGVQTMSTAHIAGITSYYSGRSLGKTSTKNYFQTDLSNLSTTDLKDNLDTVNSDFKSLEVKSEVEIRPFVEKSGFAFVKGNGFYELTKPELVQEYKEILIKDKKNGKIYGGADAKNLINMPLNGETRVRPGNHMNYAIFVQSTSVNRKLVRGTTLLYKIK